MAAIGIDLGSENCVIAQAKRGGIDVLLNQSSNRKNPLLVSFSGKQRFMGENAVSMAKSNYKNTVSCFKRFIGRKYKDADVQEEIKTYVRHKTVELENGNVGVVVNYNGETCILSMEKLMAMMLTHLKDIAKASIGSEVGSIVLSVPGYWNDAQRRGLLDAVGIAGLNVSRLMNESTANALAYGIYKNARKEFDPSVPKNVMFLDCGATAFSVSIASFIEKKLTIKSQAYDRNLGGRDFTNVLLKTAAAEFKAKTKLDVYENPKAMIKLIDAVEKAKKGLSPNGVTENRMSVECLMEDTDFNCTFKDADFIENSKDLLPRFEKTIMRALSEAAMTIEDISTVEIIGGGSRVNWIKEMLAKTMKCDTSKVNFGLSATMNADESVARGCALQCAILSPLFKVKEFLISDAIYLPVRLSWEQQVPSTTDDQEKDDDEFSETNSITIFQKNDEFPKMQRLTFRRKNEFELTAAYDESCQMNGDLPEGADLTIAKFKVSGLPSDIADLEEAPRIRVFIQTDIHGIISASSARLIQEVPKPEEPEAKEEAPVEQPASEGKAEETSTDTNMEKDQKESTEPSEGGEAKTDAAEGEAASAKEGDGEKKDDEQKDEKKEEKKKTKKIETDLKVDTVCGSLANKELNDAIEEVLQMDQQDRIIRETNDKRNELEAYIYKMRDDLDASFKAFASASDKEGMSSALSGAEDWLYTDEAYDATKSLFQSKLDELVKVATPMVSREWESKQRPAAMATLSKDVEYYLSIVNSTEDKYSHLTPEEKNMVQAECTLTQTWLTEQKATQGALTASEDPAVTTSQIQSRGKTLYNVCNPIVSRPKPKPPPAPAPEAEKKEDTEMDGQTKAEGDVEMGVDGESKDGESKKEDAGDVKMDPDLD